MAEKTKRRRGRGCLITILAITGLLVLAIAASSLSNIGLPQSQASDRLDPLDKARTAEALNVKARLGNSLWPEWAASRNPIILWNRAYEFLLNYPGTPHLAWEAVPGEAFNGWPYYRKPAADPQNFAVPIGDVWAASMATKTETDVFLIDTFHSRFPTPLKQVFPYRLLIQPSETQIGGVLHEDFHVFEHLAAMDRLAQAEAAHRYGDQYEAAAESFQAGLKQEAGLLAKALVTTTDEDVASYVSQFLLARDGRRNSTRLAAELIDYERWLEWEEGMAKYVEVNSYRLASQTTGYSPLAEMAADPYFKAYKKFNSRWSQELFQLRNPSGSSETRFYNIGMAESFLLDRLKPDWKATVMQEGVFLEDLLRQAVQGK